MSYFDNYYKIFKKIGFFNFVKKAFLNHLLHPFKSIRIAQLTYGRLRRPVRSYCPICNRGGIKEFPVTISDVTPVVFCPTCGSLERHRFFWLYFEDEIAKIEENSEKQIKLLHFAPEVCFSWKLEKHLGNNYVTADLDTAKAKLTLDITNIDLASDSFDKIICFHVLEHIPDDKKAMSELYRVLKIGGTAYVMVPIKGDKTDEDLSVTDIEERRKRFGQSDHVRFYGMDIKKRMEEIGFSVSIITPKDVVPNNQLRNLFGLNTPANYDDDFLFVLTK